VSVSLAKSLEEVWHSPNDISLSLSKQSIYIKVWDIEIKCRVDLHKKKENTINFKSDMRKNGAKMDAGEEKWTQKAE
jgi:hypothetical protein